MLNNFYIQRNLKALGYYKGNIDEIIGPQTKQAIKDFQSDFNLSVDGIYGSQTDACLQQVIKECQQILGTKADGMWGKNTEDLYAKFNNIKHFTHNEFKCKCGCNQDRIDIRLVKILDEIRDYYGKPAVITSGYRCKKHNKDVGGVTNSWHTKNKASDFYVQGVNVTELLSHCIDLRNQGKIRYTYTNNTTMNGVVHIDIGGIR